MEELKKIWQNFYAGVPSQLEKLGAINSVASAFNTNIDAVLKVSGARIRELSGLVGLTAEDLADTKTHIDTPKDVVRGIIKCFRHGIAEEWLCDAHRIAVSESYPLPDRDYDLVEYTDVKPFINYHVKIDGRFYSVPFMFRHDRLTAYVSDRIIEIYHGNAIVAVHGVLGGSRGRYSTDPSHLPQDDEIPYSFFPVGNPYH